VVVAVLVEPLALLGAEPPAPGVKTLAEGPAPLSHPVANDPSAAHEPPA
jgi:hypothetical protein